MHSLLYTSGGTSGRTAYVHWGRDNLLDDYRALLGPHIASWKAAPEQGWGELLGNFWEFQRGGVVPKAFTLWEGKAMVGCLSIINRLLVPEIDKNVDDRHAQLRGWVTGVATARLPEQRELADDELSLLLGVAAGYAAQEMKLPALYLLSDQLIVPERGGNASGRMMLGTGFVGQWQLHAEGVRYQGSVNRQILRFDLPKV